MATRRFRGAWLLLGLAACGGTSTAPSDPPLDGRADHDAGVAAEGGTGSDASPGDPPIGPGKTGCEVPPPPPSPPKSTRVGDGSKGSCTESALRAALGFGGHVELDCGPEDVTLVVRETLVVRDGTWLDGKGRVILDGERRVRILRTEERSNARVSGITFVRGKTADAGGAILKGWQGTLYVDDCRFRDNASGGVDRGYGGGALHGGGGALTVVRSDFEANVATTIGGAIHTILSDLAVFEARFADNRAVGNEGGAIFTDGGYSPDAATQGTHGGVVTLCGTRFVGNRAKAGGGAAYLYTYGSDRLVVDRSEVRDNTTETTFGGGFSISSNARVTRSTFAHNRAEGTDAIAGALAFTKGTLLVENVTFFANYATSWGAAVFVDGNDAAELVNCTFARNSSATTGGVFAPSKKTRVRNTLFVENGRAGDTYRHCLAAPESQRANLAHPAAVGDVCGVELRGDPRLADGLADHGGPTPTLALGPASAALGLGRACPETDQRGQPRSAEACDLGAFEAP